jgi:hypothetical protein
MVALAILGYLLGVVVYLLILHKTSEVADHDEEGIKALGWPVFFAAAVLFGLLTLPAYLSKAIKNLVK